MRRLSITLALSILFLISVCSAQQTSTTAVPNLIRYSGSLKDVQATASVPSTTVGVTFAIYKQQDGGAPVWMETQNVTIDANGNYSVLLGSTTATGLPSDLFSQQEQRWLGVQVQREAEQPRLLLVSVPYAFKAQEAETLGGLPPSAFALAPPSSSARNAVAELQPTLAPGLPPQSVGGSGTTNYLALWTSSTDLGDSQIYQLGSKIGIATTNPSSTLDVAGDVNVGTSNTYRIGQNKVLSTTGTANLFLGSLAGYGNTTGNSDTYAGYAAGYWNTTGSSNTFTGYEAGYRNTSGGNNAFTGANAGLSNTTGAFNTFAGSVAGYGNTTGNSNTYAGYAAGYWNTTGSSNTFTGYEARYRNTSGGNNAFTGANAGLSNTSGAFNTFAGYGAGKNNTTGNYNVYIANDGPVSGNESNAIRIGSANQSQAYVAGIYGAATDSDGAVVFVDSTGKLGTTGSASGVVTSFNGRSGAVMPASGDYSFGLLSGTLGSSQFSGIYGNAVTLSNTSNVFYGDGSHLSGVLSQPGPGSPYYIQNSTSQQASANFNISGNGTVGGTLSANVINAVSTSTNQTYQVNGSGVLGIGNSSDENLFIGVGAGANDVARNGYYNVFSGYKAGFSNLTGKYELFIGALAGYSNTDGLFNTFVGFGAGYYNSHGQVNTFTGYEAGYNNIGNGNAFFGEAAGENNTTGNDNAFFGLGAGINNTTGAGNAFFGEDAGWNNTTGSNNIYIATLGPDSGGESSTIRIGGDRFGYSSQTAAYIAGIYGSTVDSNGTAVYVDDNGQLGTVVSSRRFKDQIADMGDSSSKLFQLRPVTFFYKPQYDKGERTLQYGLIAEEVAEVYPDIVAYDQDGQPYTVKYQYLAPMLLNELQKQHAVVAAQQDVIKSGQEQIRSLQEEVQQQREEFRQRLSRLEAMIGQQPVRN